MNPYYFDGRCLSRIFFEIQGPAPEMREHLARGPVGYQPTSTMAMLITYLRRHLA